MTFISNFNINIGFNFGMNNWFSPINSCLGGFNLFGGFSIGNWFTNSFMTPPTQMFNFTNIWDNYNFNSSCCSGNIFSSGNSFWNNANTGSFWDNFSIWGNTSVAAPAKSGDSFVKSSSYKPITLDGYNATKGKKLADIAWSGRNMKKVYRHGKWTYFSGDCAKYVRMALQKAGMFDVTQQPHAYMYINELQKSKNFKRIEVSGDNYKNLPAGCILVYGRCVSDYSAESGHIEITTGDSRAVSDGTTNNIRKPSAIFIPV